MPTFGELKPDTYYLIRESADTDIEIVSVVMHTDLAVLLRSYLPSTEDYLKLKTDDLLEIVETLDSAQAELFETIYAEPEEIIEYSEETD